MTKEVEQILEMLRERRDKHKKLKETNKSKVRNVFNHEDPHLILEIMYTYLEEENNSIIKEIENEHRQDS